MDTKPFGYCTIALPSVSDVPMDGRLEYSRLVDSDTELGSIPWETTRLARQAPITITVVNEYMARIITIDDLQFSRGTVSKQATQTSEEHCEAEGHYVGAFLQDVPSCCDE